MTRNGYFFWTAIFESRPIRHSSNEWGKFPFLDVDGQYIFPWPMKLAPSRFRLSLASRRGESKAYRRITADDMCTNCPYVPRISKNIDIAKCMYPFPTLTYHFFTTSSLAPLNRYYFIKNGRNTQTQQALRLSPIQLRQGIPSVPYDRPKGRYGTCPQIRY